MKIQEKAALQNLWLVLEVADGGGFIADDAMDIVEHYLRIEQLTDSLNCIMSTAVPVYHMVEIALSHIDARGNMDECLREIEAMDAFLACGGDDE